MCGQNIDRAVFLDCYSSIKLELQMTKNFSSSACFKRLNLSVKALTTGSLGFHFSIAVKVKVTLRC